MLKTIHIWNHERIFFFFKFKLRAHSHNKITFMHKLSIRPLKQYGEILAILITYISSNLKICIYMTDLDFQKHCQIWINVSLVIK